MREMTVKAAKPVKSANPDRKRAGVFLAKVLIGVFASLGIFSVFLLTQSQNPLTVYEALIQCFVGNRYNVGEIAVKMTPVLLAGMAALIPAKVGLSNCGGEGQLIAGCLTANIAGVYLCGNLPGVIGIPVMLIASAAAGMLWAAIPLFCKMKLNMNETLTTLLSNYIMYRLVAYLVFGPIQDTAGNNYPMSARIAEQLRIPSFTGTRANFMIFFALFVVLIVWFVFSRTELGFKLRAIGGNERAAQFAGFSVQKARCLAFLTAGAIAGLGGGILMSSVEFQMRESTAHDLGFLGFLATGIAGGSPIVSIFTSFLLSALSVCGTSLEITTGLRSSASTILMSVILLTIFALGRRKRAQ